MGVILDSSVLIAGERRGESIWEILERVETACGEATAALSAVTAVELTHGVYRARADVDRTRRENFVEALDRVMAVYPLTLDVARLAGRIHGEQMGVGVSIDFADLIIGSTALFLGFGVVTLNAKHFQQIPGLSVSSLQRLLEIPIRRLTPNTSRPAACSRRPQPARRSGSAPVRRCRRATRWPSPAPSAVLLRRNCRRASALL